MKKIILVLWCLTLSACATQHQFDCPYKEGARCLSVEEIDKKIDAGEIGNKSITLNKNTFSSTLQKINQASTDFPNMSPAPLRTVETVLSLWIAPFYTQDGIYHEGHRLHFVATDAAWKMTNAEIVEGTL